MGKFNEELVKAGVMLAGDGLKPTSAGLRLRYSGAERTVIDGPFTETKELVAGFWILQVASVDEAVEWLKRAPFDQTTIEIRPLHDLADFGDNATPELRAAEDRLRTQVAEQQHS
jgi:hypothetical protein